MFLGKFAWVFLIGVIILVSILLFYGVKFTVFFFIREYYIIISSIAIYINIYIVIMATRIFLGLENFLRLFFWKNYSFCSNVGDSKVRPEVVFLMVYWPCLLPLPESKFSLLWVLSYNWKEKSGLLWWELFRISLLLLWLLF